MRVYYNFLKIFLKKLKRDNVLLYAQGLTFNTLLTLIPILGLLISFANIFIPQKTIINQFVVQLAKYLTAEATQKVVKVIIALITKLETFPLGKFSIVAYFMMSLGLLFQLEEVLNNIFESSKKRTLVQRLSFFWLCMTITPALLFLPFSFYSYFGKLSKGLVLLLIVGFFFLIYIYFPAKKVAKKEALLGAIFSTSLWVITSYLYSIYIKIAIGYSKIYGSLSAVPLFLIWVFLNWTIFLIGAELVAFLEMKLWLQKDDLPENLVKLLILYTTGKAFLEGKCKKIEEIITEFHLSISTVIKAITSLEEEGFILTKEDIITLSRIPEKIPLNSIILGKIALKSSQYENLTPLQKVINLLPELQNLTLKDLLTEKEPSPNP